MATLRLFAGLRDAAGTSRVELPGSTVGEVLDEAVRRYGPSFGSGLSSARVWVNGEEAQPDDLVSAADEVALIPPVSGGSATMAVSVSPGGLLLGVLAVVLVFANFRDSDAVVAAAIVGAVSVWAADLGTVLASRGRDLPVVPILVTIAAAVVSTRMMGAAGIAITAAVAVIASMAWGVVSESSRPIQVVAPSVLVSLMAGAAVASLLQVRFAQDAAVTTLFVAVIVVSVPAGAFAERLRDMAFGDPFTVMAMSCIVTSLAAAAVLDLEVVTYLFVGVVLAVGLVAGRALGSIIRSQSLSLAERPAGLTWAADGAVIAAALYYPVLALLT